MVICWESLTDFQQFLAFPRLTVNSDWSLTMGICENFSYGAEKTIIFAYEMITHNLYISKMIQTTWRHLILWNKYWRLKLLNFFFIYVLRQKFKCLNLVLITQILYHNFVNKCISFFCTIENYNKYHTLPLITIRQNLMIDLPSKIAKYYKDHEKFEIVTNLNSAGGKDLTWLLVMWRVSRTPSNPLKAFLFTSSGAEFCRILIFLTLRFLNAFALIFLNLFLPMSKTLYVVFTAKNFGTELWSCPSQ